MPFFLESAACVCRPQRREVMQRSKRHCLTLAAGKSCHMPEECLIEVLRTAMSNPLPVLLHTTMLQSSAICRREEEDPNILWVKVVPYLVPCVWLLAIRPQVLSFLRCYSFMVLAVACWMCSNCISAIHCFALYTCDKHNMYKLSRAAVLSQHQGRMLMTPLCAC